MTQRVVPLAIAAALAAALQCAHAEAPATALSPDCCGAEVTAATPNSHDCCGAESSVTISPASAGCCASQNAAPIARPQLELVDAGMHPLPTFQRGGRKYVLGQLGSRYLIHVVNPTPSRVEAVISVDGLDILDGRPGSTGKRGYIVPAYGEGTFDGWRTSVDTAAAFRFSSVDSSYAALTGRERNVGVIGVAFYSERRQPPPPRAERPPGAPASEPSPKAGSAPRASRLEASRTSAARSADSEGAAAARRPGLGTEFGESEESHAMETSFVRGTSDPTWLAELRYDDRRGLASRGIRLDDGSPASENDLRDTAQAFPGSRFAQPPR